MLILKRINDEEKDKIAMGNLILLIEKLTETSNEWEKKLIQTKEDHRYTQAVCSVLRDILEVLPNKSKQ